jgi:hypothetical protein
MKPTTMTSLFLAAALPAMLGPPSVATAQYRLPEITAVPKADSLHEAAMILGRSMNRWGDAARLHRHSAALRAADDSLGFRCLSMAAQLSYLRNDLSSARNGMAGAAAQALARGDILTAAGAYTDAAWLAQEQNRAGDVRKYSRQAEVLARSPLLTGAQRATILKRFAHPQGNLAAKITR